MSSRTMPGLWVSAAVTVAVAAAEEELRGDRHVAGVGW
jgi:hypothetical protein